MTNPMLDIKILARDDPPPFDEELEEIAPGNMQAFILEHGMESGKPSLGFVFTLADGRKVLWQSSMPIIEMLLGTLRGVEARG